MTKLQSTTTSSLALIICLASCVSSVSAQTLELDEIIVTATKRAQGLQNVPIALSVVDGEKIGEQGIKSLEGLSAFMPNVLISESQGGDQLFIRGIGSGDNQGFEQSVGTFIDGIYFGRGQASRTTFLDVERVEVLKGPQSTLFGKNTIAGAINITTAQPTHEFMGKIEGNIEPAFNALGTTLTLSGPLTDNLAARLVLKYDESDGHFKNSFLDRNERQDETLAGRLTLNWQPSDNLDFLLKYEAGKSENLGRQNTITIANDFVTQTYQAVDPNFVGSFDYNRFAHNVSGGQYDDEFKDSDWNILSLTGEIDIGDFTLKSITGHVGYDFTYYIDADFGPLAFLARSRDETHEQFTQEFLLSSPTGKKVEYLLGAFYQDEDLQSDRITDGVLAALGIGNGNFDASIHADFGQKTETVSAFTQVTFNASEKFKLIGGLRYSIDNKEMLKSQYTAPLFSTDPSTQLGGFYDGFLGLSTDHVFDSNGAMRCVGLAYVCTTDPTFDNTISDDHVTGDLTLQWDASDNVMAYAKYGTGYKAGGFDEDNARGFVDVETYDDETVKSYEFGTKMKLWGGRARLNTAVFLSDYKDVQVSTFDGNAGFVVGNAAESETKGIEIDGSALLSDGLVLSGSFAYLDATYQSYAGAGCTEDQILVFIAGGGTRDGCTQELAGRPLLFAPKTSGTIGLNYKRNIAKNLNLNTGIDLMYSDNYHVVGDLDQNLAQGSFIKLNGRIAIGNQNQGWSIAALIKNITNEKTTTFGTDLPLAPLGYGGSYAQFIDPPRSVEFQLSHRF